MTRYFLSKKTAFFAEENHSGYWMHAKNPLSSRHQSNGNDSGIRSPLAMNVAFAAKFVPEPPETKCLALSQAGHSLNRR
jgi:hypothetical protein